MTLAAKQVLLGVSGSIAAYKALYLVRLLTAARAKVQAVLTAGAGRFVGPLSFAALTGHPPIINLWDAAEAGEIGHVELAHAADLIVVAPATAHTLQRLAAGAADDPLSAIVLASSAPLLLAPAMETGMWNHAATQHHIATLVGRGATLIAPETGMLASDRHGVGRMAAPEIILEACHAALTPQDWRDQRVLVTAGPTRESFDPARFVSNPSTGKMGYALAHAAKRRGATVHLISGPTHLRPPAGITTVRVNRTDEMLAACEAALSESTVLIMAAAPVDYRPCAPSPRKLKKAAAGQTLRVEFASTPDILATLARRPARTPGRLVVGFAAETDDVRRNGLEKLHAKDLDMLVANAIGTNHTGFASDTNAGWLLRRDGVVTQVPLMPKTAFADVILDHLGAMLLERQ